LRNIEIGKFKIPSDVSGDCKDLLKKMIEKDPKARITASEALNHDWIKNFNDSTSLNNPISNDVYQHLKDYRGKSLLKKAAVNLLVKHLDPK
jgi:calcium-dependent protein kinase